LDAVLGETQAFVRQIEKLFEVEGTWDMAQLEDGLREALLKDGCRILEALLNQAGALGTHQPEGRLHERRTRRVQSVLGCFELRRGYYRDTEHAFPMDRLLGLTESYTPGLLRLMCLAAATDGSYEEAEQTLGVYAGLEVPASQIRRMVQQVGPDLAHWSPQREESRKAAVPTLYVSYDGTGVPMRKEETRGRKGKQPDGSAITREVKLGCVFTSHGADENGQPLRDPDSTTYVASFDPAEAFGARMRQEAVLRGYSRCQRAAVIGDGALWVWNLAQVNFPQARQILDFYHACEHVSVLASALFPNQSDRIAKQVKKWKSLLEKDRLEKMLNEARQKMPHHGPRRETAEREINYFASNASRMRYATFTREGYFIGSGVVEAGCKTVVGKRTKQSGMFWRIPGAQHILDIRCAVLGNTEEAYWLYRHTRDLQALRPAA
jgi:hypothetical protein